MGYIINHIDNYVLSSIVNTDIFFRISIMKIKTMGQQHPEGDEIRL